MADPKLPSIPAIDKSIDKNIRSIIEPVREILLALTNGENPAVRMQALTDAGLINGNKGPSIIPPDSSDFTAPPAPTGLTVDGALANMILTWDATSYRNVAETEIWRAEDNNFSNAEKVGAATDGANVYIDNVNHTGTWFYWIRYVSVAGVEGPFNAQNGTEGETGVNPSSLLELLTGEPSSPYFGQFPFLVIETPTTINGVPVPAGVYIQDAFIANGTITNAKIGTAAIDDAKIANLSAGKITAGDIDAARMTANIVAAATGKFGTLSALSSYLGTVEIGAGGYLRSAGAVSYAGGTGFWMGEDAGTYKFRIGDPAGNRLTWDGFNLNVVGGGVFSGALSAASGTFTGALVAATGTFSGALSAATGTFSGALSAASGTFTGSLSAASGTFSGNLTAQSITTDNIIGNAVTQCLGAQGYAVPSVSVTFNSTGRPCMILGRITAWNYSGDGPPDYGGGFSQGMLFRLSGGGMTDIEEVFTLGNFNEYTPMRFTRYQPPTGIVTFTASLWYADGGGPLYTTSQIGTFDLEIIVVEFKR